MNIAIILSGGIGVRLGGIVPKQYIMVGKKTVIQYCLKTFQDNKDTDGIVIVAEHSWQEKIQEWIKEDGITKFISFAEAGESRQHSIVNGMEAIKSGNVSAVNIIIHDAARPNISDELISQCFEALKEADGAMPVLPVKDTVYFSEDGNFISSLLNRDCLFAGQAPESFNFEKYYALHRNLTKEELNQIRGSSEIAFKNGLVIKMIPGDEHNYKITTEADLEKFRLEKEEQK